MFLKFHIEGEKMTFLGKLQKSQIAYNLQVKNENTKTELSVVEILIEEKDVINFLYILGVEEQKARLHNGKALRVYTVCDGEWILINIIKTMLQFLQIQQKQMKNPTNKIKTFTSINGKTSQIEKDVFITYGENWIIHFNPNHRYSKLFKQGTYQNGLMFFIENDNPEDEWEESLVETIQKARKRLK